MHCQEAQNTGHYTSKKFVVIHPQAAAAASVGTKVLVRTGKPVTPEAENAADWVLNSLADLPQAIKKQQKPA